MLARLQTRLRELLFLCVGVLRAEWQRTFKPSCGRWWPYLDAAHALAAAAPALTLTLTLTLTLARHAGGAQRARRAGRAADG